MPTKMWTVPVSNSWGPNDFYFLYFHFLSFLWEICVTLVIMIRKDSSIAVGAGISLLRGAHKPARPERGGCGGGGAFSLLTATIDKFD